MTTSRRAGLVLLALFCLGLGSLGEPLTWWPCLQAPQSFELALYGSVLVLSNTTVHIYPLNQFGERMLDNYVSLRFDGIQEWVTQPGHTCYEPDYIFPYGTAKGASTAYRGFATGDMECSFESVDGVLPNGAKTTTMVTRARNLSYPELDITFNLTTTDQEYRYTYAGVPTTNGEEYQIHYDPASFKVTLGITNFPFSAGNNSHLAGVLFGEGVISYSAYNLSYGQTPQAFIFNLTSTDGKLRFREDLDRGFLLDGVPYMNAMEHSDIPFLVLPQGYVFNDIFSFAFCQLENPGFHPVEVLWDPQLSALFDVPREPPPGTPPSSKVGGKKVPLGAILGSIFGILGAVIIFVIIYLNSPKLQAVFQPFKTEHSDHDAKTIANRWQASRGPTNPTLA